MAESAIDPASINTDRLFFALSDRTRRHLLGQLALRPMTVSELARAAEISLAAAVQHLEILEETRLAATEKVGRVRTCRIDRRGFDALERWIRNHHTLWEMRLDTLGEMLGSAGKDSSTTDD
jgi:DNA-binding transcriptional ArsR family regulator